MNRDPAGEDGGLNMYSIIANSALNNTDYLGLIGESWEKGMCIYLFSTTSTKCIKGPYHCTPWQPLTSMPDFVVPKPYNIIIGLGNDIFVRVCSFDFQKHKTPHYLCCSIYGISNQTGTPIPVGAPYTLQLPQFKVLPPPPELLG